MSGFFALAEFLHSDTARDSKIENLPTWQDIENLERLAMTLEEIRRILGDNPITLTSGFRCPTLNTMVGGVSDSAHIYGLACDFVCPAFGTPSEICKALEPHLVALDIDQLIAEGDGSGGWVHLGLAADGCIARNQCFVA